MGRWVLRGGGECALLAGAFAVLCGLENLLSAVVALLYVVLRMLTPIFLMLKTGVLAVKVPWSAGHVLRDMRIDFLAILVDRCRREAGLSSLLELFGSPEILMAGGLVIS